MGILHFLVHLLCKGTLEETRGDVEGLYPPFTLPQLDLIPKITHLQLKYLLATKVLKGLRGSKGDRSIFFRFWRQVVLFPKRFPLSHVCINKQAQGLNRIHNF